MVQRGMLTVEGELMGEMLKLKRRLYEWQKGNAT